MSLEQNISRLADAVEKLTRVLEAQASNPTPQETVQVKPAKATKAAEPKAPEPQTLAEARGLDYVNDVQLPALELVKAKGREALAEILADFGEKSAKDIPADMWPALIDRIKAGLAS